MKTLLSLIISSALVVSGYSQTRNVLVGTNNAVVQPTNFWSADASNARAGLGLGSAATNPASAFQPSSAVLSNLAAGRGAGLTNIAASNIVGTLSIGQGGTGATNASDARTALGLGTAATNAETAFQPSSTTLSNLSLGNGGNLTNLQATSLVGQIPASNIASVNITNFGTLSLSQGGTGATNAANARQNLGATTVGDALFIATNAASARTTLGATTVGNSVFTAIDAAAARTALSLGTASTNPASAFQPSSTVLSNLASSNAVNLINLQATKIVGVIPASNISSVTISNLVGTVAIASGGTGATNTGGARTNLGLGATWLTNTNVTNFRTAIGLGSTNAVSFGTVTVGVVYANSFESENYGSIFDLDSTNTINILKPLAFSSIDAAITRTNLGLGATWLTNTNVTSFRTAIGLGPTNDVIFNILRVDTGGELFINDAANIFFDGESEINISAPVTRQNFRNALEISWVGTNIAITRTNLGLGSTWLTNTNVTNFRTAIGLGWPALTNTNVGTELVSVNTNGEVVSPTNFWRVAPIQTIVQNLAPTTNSTNAATNSRNLYLYSLATSITGVVNTVILPTNASTFGGDNATIIHQGPTSSVTVIRQAGTTNNLVSINRFDESVKFIYENNAWAPYHNIGFQEPIYFSGTNAIVNIAESRKNLGLGETNDVTFNKVTVGSASVTLGQTITGGIAIGGQGTPDIVAVGQGGMSLNLSNYGYGFGTNNPQGAGITRTNLGLGATWLTNTNVTNFRTAVGLGITNNVAFESLALNSSGDEMLLNAAQINAISYQDRISFEENLIESAGDVWNFVLSNSVFQGPLWVNGPIYFQSDWESPVTNNAFYAATTRTNLGLGATNIVTFAGITNNGNIRINQTSPTNGLLFVFRTNNEPFLGIANLIASNNTTVSNETLFRVGVAEATNKAAQFGFRSTNTNGDGVAVFSTFGYNALMMIGPSSRSQSNVVVEADIYSVNPTNKVATLIDTNTGAFALHRPIGFRTNETNASPISGGNFTDRSRWLQIHVGTNTFYVPLFQ